MEMNYDELKQNLVDRLELIEKLAKFIRLSGNSLISAHSEHISEVKQVSELLISLKEVESNLITYRQTLMFYISKLEITKQIINKDKTINEHEKLSELSTMLVEVERQSNKLIYETFGVGKSLAIYNKIDRENPTGFYEEVYTALTEANDELGYVMELYNDLSNVVHDIIVGNKPDEIVPEEELVELGLQPSEEVKETYWALESFGDVIVYDSQGVDNMIIPLGIFKEKPTSKRLELFLLGENNANSTDISDIEYLIEHGSVGSEFGRQVHMPYAEYQLLECEYD